MLKNFKKLLKYSSYRYPEPRMKFLYMYPIYVYYFENINSLIIFIVYTKITTHNTHLHKQTNEHTSNAFISETWITS